MDELVAKITRMLNARAEDSARLMSMSNKELIKELLRSQRFYNLAQSMGLQHNGEDEADDCGHSFFDESNALLRVTNKYFSSVIHELGRREGMPHSFINRLGNEIYLENEF